MKILFKKLVRKIYFAYLRLIGRAYLAMEAELGIVVHRADGSLEDKGVVCRRVVTTAGVNYLVDAFQNTVEIEDFKYHGSGTGSVAEAVGDTALGAEVETRATGSQAEGATANIYKTIGTIAYTATRAITEHGIFSAASVGTLWDRSVFASINVVNCDSIEFTYQLTCRAWG